MKKTIKILGTIIIISIISTIIIPVMNMIPVKIGLIYNFLNKISESTIVNASDVDYEYAGNLKMIYVEENGWLGYLDPSENEGVHFYKAGLRDEGYNYIYTEYSLNGSEFIECEEPDQGSKSLNLNRKINQLAARNIDTHDILYKVVSIKYNEVYICFQRAYSSKLDASSGDRIYYIKKASDPEYNLEYSMDDGATFHDIEIPEGWYTAKPVEGGNIFTDKIIIRNKDTQEIIYQTPDLTNIEEEYNYENGRTTVTFKSNVEEDEIIECSYEKDGQETDGNVVEVEEDSSIILRAKANIEFSEKAIEKEIQVKVIKTEEPKIEVDEETNLEIIPGNVENDEIENIYYIIDDGDPIVYTEKVALDLEPGEHTIKAYQVTTSGIESEMSEENITIEENNDDEQNDENNEGNNEENNEKNNGEDSNDKTEPDNMNEEENTKDIDSEEDKKENKDEQKKDSSNKENEEEAKDDKKEDVNKEDKNNSSKENNVAKKEKDNKLNKVLPQTGDKVIIFAVIVMGIVLLNVVINSKKK